jgi:hypothetical protein
MWNDDRGGYKLRFAVRRTSGDNVPLSVNTCSQSFIPAPVQLFGRADREIALPHSRARSRRYAAMQPFD